MCLMPSIGLIHVSTQTKYPPQQHKLRQVYGPRDHNVMSNENQCFNYQTRQLATHIISSKFTTIKHHHQIDNLQKNIPDRVPEYTQEATIIVVDTSQATVPQEQLPIKCFKSNIIRVHSTKHAHEHETKHIAKPSYYRQQIQIRSILSKCKQLHASCSCSNSD